MYYHIELEDHSLILTEGVATENFVDNVSRENFDNWAEHEELFAESRQYRKWSILAPNPPGRYGHAKALLAERVVHLAGAVPSAA